MLGVREKEPKMFVIYHCASTMHVGPVKGGWMHSSFPKTYKVYGAALNAAAKANALAMGEAHGPGPYGVASIEHYQTKVVKMVERTNMMSGKTYLEPSNTPGFMSPSSEVYWSM